MMNTGQVVNGTRSTGGAAAATTSPELTSPMKAMKRPMPIAIAFFSSSGIARMIASRRPTSTRIVTARPSIDDQAHRLREAEPVRRRRA